MTFCRYAFEILIELSKVKPKLRNNRLPDIASLNPMHQQHSTSIWHELPIQSKADPRLIPHLLVLVIRQLNQEEIYQICIGFDHLQLCFAQHDLVVLCCAQADQGVLAVYLGAEMGYELAYLAVVLEDVHDGLVAEVGQSFVAVIQEFEEGIIFEVSDAVAGAKGGFMAFSWGSFCRFFCKFTWIVSGYSNDEGTGCLGNGRAQVVELLDYTWLD